MQHVVHQYNAQAAASASDTNGYLSQINSSSTGLNIGSQEHLVNSNRGGTKLHNLISLDKIVSHVANNHQCH